MEKSYTLLMLDQRQAHFQFSGRFLGEVVTWDIQLNAMEYSEDQPRPQSMQIESADSENVVRVKLQLAIPEVTEAEILKSIIMLRNYKNLNPGIHSWSG